MGNRFVIEDDDTYSVPKDSQCKKCVYKLKGYTEGYMYNRCDKYPGKKEDYSDLKPKDVQFLNRKCKYFKSE